MVKTQKVPSQTPQTESGSPRNLATASLQSVEAELGVPPKVSQLRSASETGQVWYNELPEEKTNPFLKFLSYFWGPIPWMIEVAAILSAVVHHWEDFGIILALLLMNAGVGFWEEYKRETLLPRSRPHLRYTRASNATEHGQQSLRASWCWRSDASVHR